MNIKVDGANSQGLWLAQFNCLPGFDVDQIWTPSKQRKPLPTAHYFVLTHDIFYPIYTPRFCMKEITDKVTGKVKEQVENVSGSFTQFMSAGRGLYFKLSETGTKQFAELVKVGESKRDAGETLVNHLRESLQEIDPKSSANQIKLAALGLLNKTLENSERFFSELVKCGEKQTHPDTSEACTDKNSKKKMSTKAA
jgi:polyhydroxyalkanoate synthesis regulator phasin